MAAFARSHKIQCQAGCSGDCSAPTQQNFDPENDARQSSGLPTDAYSEGMTLNIQRWAEQSAHSLLPHHREVFLGLTSVLNASGFADGTLTDLAKRGGVSQRALSGITHKVNSLERLGLLARRGGRVWAAPLAPPLFIKRERDAKITGTQRARILETDGHACRACRGTKRLCVDHIVAWSCGGTNDDSNLQILCGSCNSRKRDRTQEQFEALCRKAGVGLAGTSA